MEENLASGIPSQPHSPPSGKSPASKHQNGSTESPGPTPLPSSGMRLWRPAAQRNLRNRWSKLASYMQKWASSPSSAGQPAASLVNSYLSHRGVGTGACSDVHLRIEFEGKWHRLLVLEFLSIKSQEELITNGVYSLDELYPGEFDDFCVCGSYSKEACEPLEPKLKDRDSKMPAEQPNHQPEAEVEAVMPLISWGSEDSITVYLIFQNVSACVRVYLTAWLAEVNIEVYRWLEVEMAMIKDSTSHPLRCSGCRK